MEMLKTVDPESTNFHVEKLNEADESKISGDGKINDDDSILTDTLSHKTRLTDSSGVKEMMKSQMQYQKSAKETDETD